MAKARTPAAEPEHHDVVVIGAGVAGLRCAHQLVHRKGVSDVLVVDAMDRVGGRVCNDTSFIPGMSIEVGAEFVHGSNTTLTRLAEELHIDLREIFTWAQGDGGPTEPAPDGGVGYYYLGDQKRMLSYDDEDEEFLKFNLSVADLCDVAHADEIPEDKSMLDYFTECGISSSMMKLADAGYANTAGGPMADISMRITCRYEKQWVELEDEGDFRVVPSFVRFVEHFAEGVTTRLNWPVTSVDYSDPNRILVTGPSGETLSCRTLVVTVSTAVFSKISYAPALPQEKLDAVASFDMRRAGKVLLHMSGRFWPENAHGIVCSDSFLPEFWFNSTKGIGTVIHNGGEATKVKPTEEAGGSDKKSNDGHVTKVEVEVDTPALKKKQGVEKKASVEPSVNHDRSSSDGSGADTKVETTTPPPAPTLAEHLVAQEKADGEDDTLSHDGSSSVGVVSEASELFDDDNKSEGSSASRSDKQVKRVRFEIDPNHVKHEKHEKVKKLGRRPYVAPYVNLSEVKQGPTLENKPQDPKIPSANVVAQHAGVSQSVEAMAKLELEKHEEEEAISGENAAGQNASFESETKPEEKLEAVEEQGDEEDEDVQYLITGFAGSECAERLVGMNPDVIVERFLDQLDTIFGTSERPSPAREHFVKGMYKDWGDEEYVGGGYAFPRVGMSDTAARDLAAPVAKRIFFAGEATAYEQPGMSVHAAIDTGTRAAAQVSRALQEMQLSASK